MTHYKTVNKNLVEGIKEIKHFSAQEVFARLYRNYQRKFLFESKDVAPIYGRLSLIGLDPIIRVCGKRDTFEIEIINQRGEFFFDQLLENDFSVCDEVHFSEKKIAGKIVKDGSDFEESQRSKSKNISQMIRILLEKFKIEERSFLGFYGGFAYDFVRLFEDIGEELPENEINDFELYLYDTFIYFDHLKERAEIVLYRETTQDCDDEIEGIFEQISTGEKSDLAEISRNFEVSDNKFSFSKAEFEELVEIARDNAKRGELMEVVFANTLKAKFKGDPFALYVKYSEINPSPYMFFMDFGKDQLVGASPEMMVRVENGIVHNRPISGTARRGADPIEDHENMLNLLASEKERSELDMLIDLGRNDLARICEPGIKISDYRFVEKYSRVMHTVAHLSGRLKEDYIALDALIACVNAGTLTGAPKVAAMKLIEKSEKERRGYYGGNIGYLTFSGEMDTCIAIRTTHIVGEELNYKSGATLLYDSVPEMEYQEIVNKAQAFLEAICSKNNS